MDTMDITIASPHCAATRGSTETAIQDQDMDSLTDPTLPKYIMSLPAPSSAQARLVSSPEQSATLVVRLLPNATRVIARYVPKNSSIITKILFLLYSKIQTPYL